MTAFSANFDENTAFFVLLLLCHRYLAYEEVPKPPNQQNRVEENPLSFRMHTPDFILSHPIRAISRDQIFGFSKNGNSAKSYIVRKRQDILS